jgi:hypothetical protein
MPRPGLFAACLLLPIGVAVAQNPDPGELHRLLTDWAGLTHYGSEDTEVRPPKPGEDRVVFLGDDVTEFWSRADAGFFPGKPYLNRGIARQTTPQMLVRFRQCAIATRSRRAAGRREKSSG